MHWDRLFEDLEGQLASEWEAERAALDAESERLRIAKIDLRSRLQRWSATRHPLIAEFADGTQRALTMHDVGVDWLSGEAREGAAPRALAIIPLSAVAAIGADQGALLESLEVADAAPSLRSRMTLGFLLRDLARKRIPITITLLHGRTIHGTIDRAGVDHLDLAIHDAGQPRRASAVRSFRIIAFTAVRELVVGAL